MNHGQWTSGTNHKSWLSQKSGVRSQELKTIIEKVLFMQEV
ncbi:MAG TPA: hypothetical protein V6C71_11430 [Coleofasciculaceae cyanobacterium]